MLKKKNILLTGVSGFVGSHLAKRLASEFNVFGIDNLSNYYDVQLKLDRNLNFLTNCKFDKIDITNKESLQKYFKNKNFNFVIHLAAQAGVRYSFQDPYSYIKTNIEGSYNLFETIKECNIEHCILASTSSVYGFCNHTSDAFKENLNSSWPISLYASTKKSMEVMAHSYSYNFKIPISVIRFFTVYGPWGRPDMALFKFMKNINENKPIDVYNNGKLWRDFTYIDDLIESICRLIKQIPNKKKIYEFDTLSDVAPYRTVNIGNNISINLLDFIKILEENISKRIKVNYMPMQAGDVPFTLSDTALLKKITGYAPSTSIKYGVKKFCEWYKQYYN